MEVQHLKKIIRTKLFVENSPSSTFSALLFDENGNKLVSLGRFDLSEKELHSLKAFKEYKNAMFSVKLKQSNFICLVNNEGHLVGRGNFNTKRHEKLHNADGAVTIAMRRVRGYSVIVTCSGEHDGRSVITGLNTIADYVLQNASDEQ